MQEKAPKPAASEEEATKLPLHEEIAGEIIDRFGGDIDDETRKDMTEIIGTKVKNIHNKYSQQSDAQEAQKAEFAALIASLRKDTDSSGAAEGDATVEHAPTARAKGAPEDAAAYDYDVINTPKESTETYEQVGSRARAVMGIDSTPKSLSETIAGVQARGMIGLGNMIAAVKDRHQTRLDELTPEEKEKRHKRLMRVAKAVPVMAAVGLVGAYLTRIGISVETDDVMALGGGGNTAPHTVENHDINLAAFDDKTNMNVGGSINFEDFLHKPFNGSDVYMSGHVGPKEFAGDFGPALRAMTEDQAMPPGWTDLMQRGKTSEATGLANMVSGLGLDGEGTNMADRNALADLYEHNPAAQQHGFEQLEQAIKDGKFTVSYEDINQPYDTTWVTSDKTIAYKESMTLGGKMIVFTDTDTGEKRFFRTNCGGFQEIFFKSAPQSTEPSAAIPQVSAPAPVVEQSVRPIGEVAPVPKGGGPAPEQPQIPGGPGTPGTVTPPEGGGTPDKPVDTVPKVEPRNIYNNPGLADGLGNADDRFTSGELKEATEPGATYTSPAQPQETAPTGGPAVAPEADVAQSNHDAAAVDPNLATPVDTDPTDNQPAANNGSVEG